MSFPRHLRKKRPKPRPNSRPGRLDLTSVKLRSNALGRCRFVFHFSPVANSTLFAFTDYWLLTTVHVPRTTLLSLRIAATSNVLRLSSAALRRDHRLDLTFSAQRNWLRFA